MRDKGLVFEEMRRVQRTLGMRDGSPWIEMAIGIALQGCRPTAGVQYAITSRPVQSFPAPA